MFIEAVGEVIARSNRLRRLLRGIVDRVEFDSAKGSVKLGKHIVGMPKIFSWRTDDKLVVGNFCMFGHDSTILLSGEHDLTRVSCYGLKSRFTGLRGDNIDGISKGSVSIGNDVWIGHKVTILSGVTIGDGAVIGAGSVVVSNIPPYAIAAGVPARIIRSRFSKRQIDGLLKIAWWNWSEKKIIANLEYFYGDVDVFIHRFGDCANAADRCS